MKTPFEIALTIIEDIKEDSALMACKSFSELHDHCDANTLGCQEDEFTKFHEGNGCLENTVEGNRNYDEFMNELNEAQNLVDSWLKVKDKTYFSISTAEDMRVANCIENAAAIADLQEALHDFKEKVSEIYGAAQIAIAYVGDKSMAFSDLRKAKALEDLEAIYKRRN